jgi:DNA-binding SARP family transcriptional activator/TolB-like protein/Tfp pilus assembly protein PilF
MGLVIGLLGPLVIENDQRRLGKLPRKARALMAYLAAQGGRPVSREQLSDLLWPRQASEGRHSLRNCLLELRKALGQSAERYLAAEFANCRLQDIDTDIDRFERLSRSKDRLELATAAELYRGEFLADFVVDSEPFQEWLANERDRTLDLVRGVLQRLAALQDEAAEGDAAIKSARRLAALDPLSEIGQRVLIRAYARAGRQLEALLQYRTCAETLKRELGVAPDAETQALANEIVHPGGIGWPVTVRTAERPGDMRAVIAEAPVPSSTDIGLTPSLHEMSRLRWPCLLPSVAVAVAPLRNLTGEPEQQYLMEAFTDDLVTDLLRHGPNLSLTRIADERQAPGTLPRIASTEIEYLVTGSALRSGPRTFQVNVQITDAGTAEYRWAGRYEFDLEGVGSTQTRVTRQVSREVHALLLREVNRRAFVKAGVELGLGECLAQAAGALRGKIRPELTAEAQRWFLAALALDPRNVEALTGLAKTCQHLVSAPWWADSSTATVALDVGQEAIAAALELAPRNAVANCIQGMLYSAGGRLEEAATTLGQALGLDPHLASAHAFLGYNSAFLGHAEDTVPAVERAMRFDQSERRQSIFFFFSGFAELLLGRTDDAISLLQKSLERNPSYGGAQLFLMAGLSLLGRKADAARAVAAFRDQYPGSRANDFEQLWLSRSTCSAYHAQIHPVFAKIRSLGVGG